MEAGHFEKKSLVILTSTRTDGAMEREGGGELPTSKRPAAHGLAPTWQIPDDESQFTILDNIADMEVDQLMNTSISKKKKKKFV